MEMPGHGKHPIKCSNKKCKWKGYETEMSKQPAIISGVTCQQSVCPECGCDSYMFLTRREFNAFIKKTNTAE